MCGVARPKPTELEIAVSTILSAAARKDYLGEFKVISESNLRSGDYVEVYEGYWLVAPDVYQALESAMYRKISQYVNTMQVELPKKGMKC